MIATANHNKYTASAASLVELNSCDLLRTETRYRWIFKSIQCITPGISHTFIRIKIMQIISLFFCCCVTVVMLNVVWESLYSALAPGTFFLWAYWCDEPGCKASIGANASWWPLFYSSNTKIFRFWARRKQRRKSFAWRKNNVQASVVSLLLIWLCLMKIKHKNFFRPVPKQRYASQCVQSFIYIFV